jgi:hypothetical protein
MLEDSACPLTSSVSWHVQSVWVAPLAIPRVEQKLIIRIIFHDRHVAVKPLWNRHGVGKRWAGCAWPNQGQPACTCATGPGVHTF